MSKATFRQQFLIVGTLFAAVVCGIIAYFLSTPLIIAATLGAGILAYLSIDYFLTHLSPSQVHLAKRREGLYRKICPRCGSIDVSSYSPPGYLLGRGLSDRCLDCGYGSPQGKFWTRRVVFPEVTQSGLLGFRENLKRKKRS